jgi:hypothetical protein
MIEAQMSSAGAVLAETDDLPKPLNLNLRGAEH